VLKNNPHVVAFVEKFGGTFFPQDDSFFYTSDANFVYFAGANETEVLAQCAVALKTDENVFLAHPMKEGEV